MWAVGPIFINFYVKPDMWVCRLYYFGSNCHVASVESRRIETSQTSRGCYSKTAFKSGDQCCRLIVEDVYLVLWLKAIRIRLTS